MEDTSGGDNAIADTVSYKNDSSPVYAMENTSYYRPAERMPLVSLFDTTFAWTGGGTYHNDKVRIS